MKLRIGHGYDVHRLTEGRKLILGGSTSDHFAAVAARDFALEMR